MNRRRQIRRRRAGRLCLWGYRAGWVQAGSATDRANQAWTRRRTEYVRRQQTTAGALDALNRQAGALMRAVEAELVAFGRRLGLR